MNENEKPSLQDLRVKKIMEEQARKDSLEDKRVSKIMEEQAKGDSLEDLRVKKIMEQQAKGETLEDKRIKKLMEQQSKENTEKHISTGNHHISEKKPAPDDNKLRLDQIDSQEGRVPEDGVQAINAITPVRAVQASPGMDPVHFADALEQWRYMSEQYRNKRLAKERIKNPTENQTNNFNVDEYQNDYEEDNIDISETQNDNQLTAQEILYSPNTLKIENKIDESKLLNSGNNQNSGIYQNPYTSNNQSKSPKNNLDKNQLNFREMMIQTLIGRLSSANIDIDPNMIEENENNDIIPKGNILTVSDVMTKNVISVIDSMTVEQVATIFNRKKITGVPVIHYQSKYPMGIITMSDIISHIFEDGAVTSLPIEGDITLQQESLAILDKPIRDLMHTEIIEVSTNTSIKDTCKMMLDNEIHRVLVTQNNKVRGIFTSFDAVRILAQFDIQIN